MDFAVGKPRWIRSSSWPDAGRDGLRPLTAVGVPLRKVVPGLVPKSRTGGPAPQCLTAVLLRSVVPGSFRRGTQPTATTLPRSSRLHAGAVPSTRARPILPWVRPVDSAILGRKGGGWRGPPMHPRAVGGKSLRLSPSVVGDVGSPGAELSRPGSRCGLSRADHEHPVLSSWTELRPGGRTLVYHDLLHIV